MKAYLTRSFPFSASYVQGSRVIGHNYELEVTVDALDEAEEKVLESKVSTLIIERIHSHDISLHANFLLPKRAPVTDTALLEAFWHILSPALGSTLKRLSLKRGGGHRICLEP